MNLWCLHGAVGMAADWDHLAERMAVSGHEVKALDLWSYLEGGECSFQEFGRKICEEARREEHPPLLVGYSMGGRLALHALLEDSEAWSGAMIVSAHPGLQDEGERLLRMATDAEWGVSRAVGVPVRPAGKVHGISGGSASSGEQEGSGGTGIYFMDAGETG